MHHIFFILLLLLPLPSAQGSGLSLDPCRADSDCVLPRTCKDVNNVALPCNSATQCWCVPPELQICSNPAQCQEGETCFALETSFPACGSIQVIQTVPAAAFITSPIGNGFSFAQCSTDEDCVPDRTCRLLQDVRNFTDLPSCQGRPNCICFPSITDAVLCNADSDCIPEEVCIAAEQSEGNLCASPFAAIRFPGVFLVEPPVPVSLTQDPCQFSAECKSPRTCISSMDGRACIDRTDCRCFQDRFCGTSDQCEEGEVCARIGNSQQCMSANFVASRSDAQVVSDPGVTPTTRPTPSPVAIIGPRIPSVIGAIRGGGTGESSNGGGAGESSNGGGAGSIPIGGGTSSDTSGGGVCIGSFHLKDLSSEQRVFQMDVVASVLCDHAGSCATPGHFVIFRHRAMMMRSYCEHVACTERIMHVNSPRYAKGWRIKSFSPDLEFTALAARYETKTEEMLLRLAVHFGV